MRIPNSTISVYLCMKKKRELKASHKAWLKKIGNHYKELRIAAEYTNRNFFAYEHGLNPTQISRLESGEDMYLTSLFTALDALKISPDKFFAGIK